jgi:hypothetical protein
MEFLVGNDWMQYFDVVIVQARKPKFFTDESRPFRIYDRESRTQLWDRVTSLEKGKIYYEVLALKEIHCPCHKKKLHRLNSVISFLFVSKYVIKLLQNLCGSYYFSLKNF